MKKRHTIVSLLLCLFVAACYDKDIDGLNGRVDDIENKKIATLQEQIAAIDKTLPELEKADEELSAYITGLQSTAKKLEEEIAVAEESISAVEEALEKAVQDAEASNNALAEQLNNAKTTILNQLENTKAEVSEELAKINNTISTMQSRDKALEDLIDELREYTDGELQNTKDWAEGTFATIEKYNECATEIATIKVSIAAQNNTIAALESKLTNDTNSKIEQALAIVDNNIKEAVSDITAEYTKAVSEAKENITAKYTQAISTAISDVEASIKLWVNEQLTGYYTIAQVDEKLAILNDACATKENLQSEITNMANSLEQAKSEITAAYTKAIEDAINSGGFISGDFEEAIKKANAEIENKISAIESKIAIIESRLDNVEKEIADISTQIKNINTTIESLRATESELDKYIKTLQNTAGNLQKAIDETNDKINELEEDLSNEISIAKAEMLAELAELKTELNGELTVITSAIATLQTKDAELEQEITDLQTFVQNELNNTKDWTTATFATLEQYNSLAEDVAVIKEQINSINNNISQLETRINNKIKTDIASAVSTLESTIQQKVTEITDGYTGAISKAKTDITSAYTEAIDVAIFSLETSMQTWVNEQLSNYYTIAQIDAKLSTLEQNFNTTLGTQKSNLTELINSLSNDVTSNATLITKNATAINSNIEAIAQNVADIKQLRQDLATAKSEITEAYKAAIETAIETLDGALRDEISTQVENINTRINNEVTTVNNTISALDTRISDIEKEVKNIKIAIYSIQTEIANMQEQIAAIIARIQSVSFVPEYSDGKATMFYTNSSGTITAGSATLKYEIRPAEVAEEMAEVWEKALSIKAVYTKTRAAAGEFVELNIESATANEGILSLVVSGANFDEAFFRSEIQANIRLEISNDYNCITSGYTQIVPWTTDVVYIPDNNFKTYLVGEFDTNSDGEISLAEAEEVKEINIAASLLQVKSMAGIEYFTNLEKLDCSFNRITTLDLAGNSKLTSVNVSNNKLTSLTLPASVTSVDASNNQLTSLDVSKATALTQLNINSNKLTTLNVGQNKALQTLKCNDNDLVAIDVTKLISLTELACGGNNIPMLNVSRNTLLTTLDCHDNDLAVLDLTKNIELEKLYCEKNNITAMYIGSNKLQAINCANNAITALNLSLQTNLASLDCSHNALVLLDITKCCKLDTVDCSYNALKSLNISNNNLTTLDCSGNYELAKVWVKDEAQTNTTTITKESTTGIFYNNGGVNFPDAALKAYLVNNYDDDGDGEISIAESDNITMINCSGKGVSDLSGLEVCSNLVTLNCSNNSITTIELPNLAQLVTLTCNGNPIERINLNNCTALEYLNLQGVTTNAINGNAISIDGYTQANALYFTAQNTKFTSFTFKNSNTVTSLEYYGEFTDVNNTNNTALTSVVFFAPVEIAVLSGNSVLEGLNIQSLLQLSSLDIQNCKLQALDVTKNLALTELICSNNGLTTLDVSNNTALEKLYCNNNQLPKINVTANTALKEFDIADNLLSALNVRNNTELTYLSVSNNAEMSMVDVKSNPALETLIASGLAITDIDLRENTLLKGAELFNTNLTTINKLATTGLGVVYEKKTAYKQGKMMSIEETTAKWGPTNSTTNAANYDNGAENMATIKNIDSSLSNYPAFKWCDEYGTDWYLPSIHEVNAISKIRSTINSTLNANNCTTLDTSYYWSSTERDYYYAFCTEFSSGYNYTWSKGGYIFYVRAILAF